MSRNKNATKYILLEGEIMGNFEILKLNNKNASCQYLCDKTHAILKMK